MSYLFFLLSHFRLPILFWVVAILLQPAPTPAQIPLTPKLDLIGDTRVLASWQYGTGRMNDEINSRSAVLRIRAGVRYRLRDDLDIQIRYGLRVHHDTRKLRPGIHTTGDNHRGLRPGEGAFDIVSVRYRPHSRLQLEAGRFQTSSIIWSVPGAIKYSFYRFEGNGPNVHWVDGAQLFYRVNGLWHVNLAYQLHHHNAPTNIYYAPLEIAENTPLSSWYGAFHRVNNEELLRLVTLSFIHVPRALEMDLSGRLSGYLTASGKFTLGWHLPGGRQLLLENEIGYAFRQPENLAMGLPGNPGEKGKALAWMTTLNYVDFLPNQSLGVLAARVPMTMMTSPFLNNNLIQYEVRHVWDITPRIHIHSFMRYMIDLEKPLGSDRRRERLFPVVWMTYFFR